MPAYSKTNAQNEQDIAALQATSGGATAWNGLTKIDNSIGLGGALSQDTTITGLSSTDFIINLDSGRAFLNMQPDIAYGEPVADFGVSGTLAGRVVLQTGAASLEATDASGTSNVYIWNNGIRFWTGGNLQGAFYESDYFPTQLHGDRWIPDMGALHATIDASATNKITVYNSPASNANGTLGDTALDPSYYYICTSTNTWGRILMETGY